MRTHADEVLEITVALLRAMTCSGIYDPAHPSYDRAIPKLHRDLTRLLRVQPEIAFVTAPPAIPGGRAELHVDGTGPARVELRRIIPPSMGGAFALQLLQSMQERDVVVLAFRKDVTLDELVMFLLIWSEGEPVPEALAERGMFGVVALSSSDLVDAGPRAPFHARVALSRLSRDLAARDGAFVPSAPAVCEELVADAVRPFVRQVDALFDILAHAHILEPRLAAIPELEGIAPIELIVRGLPRVAVDAVVAAGIREGEGDELRREVLRFCGERLAVQDATPDSERVLRKLWSRDILDTEQLPPDLQEWARAERWVVAAEEHAEPPPSSASMLSKAARIAIESERYGAASVAVDALQSLDPTLVRTIFDPETMHVIARRLPLEPERLEEILALCYRAAGDPALEALGVSLAKLKARPANEGARFLAELGPTGEAAARRITMRAADREASARKLLARG